MTSSQQRKYPFEHDMTDKNVTSQKLQGEVFFVNSINTTQILHLDGTLLLR